jgi:thymidylate kinase
MRKLIILEGPDRAGKTTLGKFLAHRLDAYYYHMSGVPAFYPYMIHYHRKVLEDVLWNVEDGRTVILDRTWLSELIYGMHFRPELAKHFPFDDFKEQIRKARGLYIICLPDNAIQRHKEDPDPTHHYDDKNFAVIVSKYSEWLLEHAGDEDVFSYNVEQDGSDLQKFCTTIERL